MWDIYKTTLKGVRYTTVTTVALYCASSQVQAVAIVSLKIYLS